MQLISMKLTSAAFVLGLILHVHSDQSSSPSVLQLIEVSNGTLILNRDTLNHVFDQIPSDETEIGILSIAGEYRKGKSFLLNFFLQYLRHRIHHPPSLSTASEEVLKELIYDRIHPWLRDVDREKGFHFKAGVKRDTTGISIYSEPFIIKRSDGKDLAIIILDSQGLYDSSTESNDNVRLFSLISLLSSTLMYNTAGNINSKQLLELKSFTDYATTSSVLINNTKPFQHLTFVIRDFTLGECGWTGGREVLDQFLDLSSGDRRKSQVDAGQRSHEVIDLARNLSSVFSSITAYALPFPGAKVVRQTYNGSLDKIDLKFLQHVEEFVINVTESLEARKPLVIPLTANNVKSYFINVVGTLNNQLPPDELLRLQERNLMIGTFKRIEEFMHEYEIRMQNPSMRMDDAYFMSRDISQVMDDVEARHQEVSEDILDRFRNEPYAYSIFEIGLNGTAVTAIQSLRGSMENRMNQMRPQLRLMIEKRIDEAAWNKRTAAAKVAEEKKRLEEKKRKAEIARREYEDYVKYQNEVAKKKREQTFWDKLLSFFKDLFGIMQQAVIVSRRNQ